MRVRVLCAIAVCASVGVRECASVRVVLNFLPYADVPKLEASARLIILLFSLECVSLLLNIESGPRSLAPKC